MTKRLSVLVFVLVSVSLIFGTSPAVSWAAKEKGKPASATTTAQSSLEQQAAFSPLNLNTATAEELQRLPGVGPKIAQEIVAYREANGPFKSTEELIKVRGIGSGKFQKIRRQVTVE